MSFKDREEAYENQFAHDEDLRFRVQARRDKLFGLWIAEQLGKKGNDADQYARSVVDSNLDKPGDEDMLSKVRADLEAAKVEIADAMLQRRLEEFHSQARQQVMKE